LARIVIDPEIAAVAIATLTKMISLLVGELVLGIHGDDIDIVEGHVRAKLFATVDGISVENTAVGVALAHQMVAPVLRDIRARVEARAAADAPGEMHNVANPRRLN
jgi:hypothetical protein